MSKIKKVLKRILRKQLGKQYREIDAKMNRLITVLTNEGYIPFMDVLCARDTGDITTIYLSLYHPAKGRIYITEGGWK